MSEPAPISGEVFAAVGDDGLRAFSKDGRIWEPLTLGKEGESLQSVCIGLGRCLAAGRFGGDTRFFVSGDGINWVESKQGGRYSSFVRGLFVDSKGFYVMLGGDSGSANPSWVFSKTGESWPEKSNRVAEKETDRKRNSLLRRFASGNGRIVAVGDYGRRCVTTDWETWKDVEDASPADTLIDVAFGNGVFVGGGMHGLRMTSTDGLEWTHRKLGEEGEHINSMLWDGKQFVGVGQGATFLSADGVDWKRVQNQNAPTTATFGKGFFVGTLWRGRMLMSKDGIEWEEVAQLPKNVSGLTFGEMSGA